MSHWYPVRLLFDDFFGITQTVLSVTCWVTSDSSPVCASISIYVQIHRVVRNGLTFVRH
jgi:hypothetical protein